MSAGWVYVRVPKETLSLDDLLIAICANNGMEFDPRSDVFAVGIDGDSYYYAYNDTADGSRVISSERVEEAVAMRDIIRRCKDEELTVTYHPTESSPWMINWMGETQSKTLPKAYAAFKRMEDK